MSLHLAPVKPQKAKVSSDPDAHLLVLIAHESIRVAQIPFAYHDGYLSVHFEAHKYQDIKLTPLQEEAVW